jgi:hypothetical protein
LRILTVCGRVGRLITSEFQLLTVKFPMRLNREFVGLNRELSGWKQGLNLRWGIGVPNDAYELNRVLATGKPAPHISMSCWFLKKVGESMSEPAVKNPTMTVRCAGTAALLSPTGGPAWLPKFLADWAPGLMLQHAVFGAQPAKGKMRKRLMEVGDAAAVLQRALQDTPTRDFLEQEGGIQIENFGSLDHALRVVEERAGVAANSSGLKRGRGKGVPTDAITPKAYCAIVVRETWKFLRGAYPAPRNIKAAEAAEAFWRASDGPIVRSWGKDSRTAWKHHFKKAESPAMEQMRREVHRHLIEHSHLNQLLSGSGK